MKAVKQIPDSLMRELQNYVQGQSIYIPKRKEEYDAWGSKSGGREALKRRNKSILEAFSGGESIASISERYYLSMETIKKIVYGKR
ncbi:Mor family transcriptional regulator [Rossellomorea marisflavi]